MSYYPSYEPNNWKCECMVCGRIFKGSQIRKRWDGYLVCKDDYEEKHDQLSVRGVRDNQCVPFSLREEGESAAPANFEVSQNKGLGQSFTTDIERTDTLPTSPEAGDRVFYNTVGTVVLSDGTNWYFTNGVLV